MFHSSQCCFSLKFWDFFFKIDIQTFHHHHFELGSKLTLLKEVVPFFYIGTARLKNKKGKCKTEKLRSDCVIRISSLFPPQETFVFGRSFQKLKNLNNVTSLEQTNKLIKSDTDTDITDHQVDAWGPKWRCDQTVSSSLSSRTETL